LFFIFLFRHSKTKCDVVALSSVLRTSENERMLEGGSPKTEEWRAQHYLALWMTFVHEYINILCAVQVELYFNWKNSYYAFYIQYVVPAPNISSWTYCYIQYYRSNLCTDVLLCAFSFWYEVKSNKNRGKHFRQKILSPNLTHFLSFSFAKCNLLFHFKL
jgi:hypothetical protein